MDQSRPCQYKKPLRDCLIWRRSLRRARRMSMPTGIRFKNNKSKMRKTTNNPNQCKATKFHCRLIGEKGHGVVHSCGMDIAPAHRVFTIQTKLSSYDRAKKLSIRSLE